MTPLAGAPTIAPRDVPELAAFLDQANRERTAVAIRGAGTKRAWGSPPSRVAAVLSTTGLGGAIDHCAGELTATVPAGATLQAVNEVLARSGQWLPLDPAHADRATIGGVIAANDSGPRRQQHGTPRDLIIGIEMVRADGRVAKAGGKVVKNVAGYDLARMLCGSFGTLAIVTAATFKLAPLSPASRTVVAAARDARSLADLARAVAESPAAPSAIELESPPHRLLVRFETTEGAADRQAAETRDLCRGHGADAQVIDGSEEAGVWRRHGQVLWGSPAEDSGGAILKVCVLPTDIGALLERTQGTVIGRAGLGVLYLRANQGIDVNALRSGVAARGGSVVVLAAPPDTVDRWGDLGAAGTVMRAVKARFDPNRILNPGVAPWS